MDYNSPYFTPVNNHYYKEPESPAGLLGYIPEQLAPVLRKQQQFLQDKLAQPQLVLTRPTTTSYCCTMRIATTPDLAFYTHLQQDAAQLGITTEELATISKESICEQNEWLMKDEANWRECEEMRW